MDNRIRVALAFSTILCSGFAAPLLAQSADGTPIAPVESSPDGYGVDLATGALNLTIQDISVGTEQSGLTHERHWVGRYKWRDEFDYTLHASSTKVVVSLGGHSKRFTVSGQSFISDHGDGATLAKQVGGYLMTLSDGTVITFGAFDYRDGYRATKIEKPTGETLSFHYKTGIYWLKEDAAEPAEMTRLQTVTSSNGYTVSYEYAVERPTDRESADNWLFRTGIRITNNVRGAIVGSTKYSFTSRWDTQTIVTDHAGNATVYGLDGTGQITSIKRPGSAAADITIAYNQVGRISSVSDVTGTTSYTYTDSGNRRTTRVVSPSGSAASYVFDIPTQRMISSTDSAGGTTSWQFDSYGRPLRVSKPGGTAEQYTYDARGNVTATSLLPKAGAAEPALTSTATYSCQTAATCDKPVSVRDAKGNQTDFTYDPVTGNVLSITLPADNNGIRAVSRFEYSLAGGAQRLARASLCLSAPSCPGQASERVTLYSYDANGLVTTVTNQAGDGSLASSVTNTYDAAGNVISSNGPLPGSEDTIYFRYDALRRQIGSISADPDGAGPLLRRAQRTTYDARGRAVLSEAGTVLDPSESGWANFTSLQQVSQTYDGADRLLIQRTTAGGTTYSVKQNSYTAQRLACSAVRMNPSAWGALPWACTQQTAGSYGPDRITSYDYDAANRIIAKTEGYQTPSATTERTTYNLSGQTASLSDGNDNATTYSYDAYDRLQRSTFPNGSFEQLSYDANSNVTLHRLRDGNIIGFAHDARNRLVSTSLPGLAIHEYSRGYAYDQANNLIHASDANGHFATLVYDALGRQISEQSNFSTRYFAYDSGGRRTKLTWQDGFFVGYDYLVTGEISAIRENGGLALASYNYDDLGRRTGIVRGNGNQTAYVYNTGSELVSLRHDLGGGAQDTRINMAYNPSGQIISRELTNSTYSWPNSADDVNRPYSVNNLNQYTQSGAVDFSYDLRGNLTRSGSTTYGYTAENRLATGPGGFLAYDPLGRLHDENGGSYLQYDGQRLITEQSGSGAILRRYVHGPGVDEPIVWYEGPGVTDRRWLIADERGSIVAVTNASGNALAVNRYDEYGIPALTNIGRFQYTGQMLLPSFGLYHYKARAYSPSLGRFMQTDPIGYRDGLNMYAYAGNDPVNFTDPTGLAIDPVTGTIIVRAGSFLLPKIVAGGLSLLGGILGFGGGPSPSQILKAKKQEVDREQDSRGSAQQKACNAPLFKNAINNKHFQKALRSAVSLSQSTPSRFPSLPSSEAGFTYGPKIFGSGYGATGPFTDSDNGAISRGIGAIRSYSYLRNVHPLIYVHTHTPGAKAVLSGVGGDVSYSNNNNIPVIAYDYDKDIYLCHMD